MSVYIKQERIALNTEPFFQQPGELDYAELDDFRPSVQPATAAEAAPARPLIRRPVYEGEK